VTPESPPGFIVRTEAQKVTYERGFRLERGVEGPWLRYASTTAPGEVWLAGVAPSGPWFLAINHPGVATELAATDTTAALSGPGVARFEYARLRALYDALDRVYRLARSLPTVPLAHFQQAAAGLPRSTEAERMTIQRIGQNLFRTALMEYWDGRCPLTGITDPALLRASHIVPWASCDSDAQRLDVHNGLLLSALWDGVVQVRVTPKTRNPFIIKALSISGVTWKWHFLNHAPKTRARSQAHDPQGLADRAPSRSGDHRAAPRERGAERHGRGRTDTA